jgi:hypothetical protein
MLVAPAGILRLWAGEDQASAGARLAIRALAWREIALGAGTVFAVDHDAPVRGWLEAGTLVDASDAVSALAAFRRLPLLPRVAIPMASGAAVVVGRRLVSQLS